MGTWFQLTIVVFLGGIDMCLVYSEEGLSENDFGRCLARVSSPGIFVNRSRITYYLRIHYSRFLGFEMSQCYGLGRGCNCHRFSGSNKSSSSKID
ncbi:hypothetical protein CC2G_004590 [Coprinopsis cinerea AmutBmut pab1-1]|nr:hypothetical protein CC2G_004590 [Coprinopsis cinerea AmutBmut pab1-1]